MRGACLSLAVLTSLATIKGLPFPAQANNTDDFDELARHAAALVQTNPRGAAQLYRQGLALRPSWAEGWFYLGASLSGLKEKEEAAKAFRRAAVLAPENGAVWGFLGLTEADLGQEPQALADIRKGEAVGLPDNLPFVSAVRNRGASLCLRKHDFDGAIKQLKPLAELGDKSPLTVSALGVTALGLPYLSTELPPDHLALVQLAGRAMYALYSQQAEGEALFGQLVSQYGRESGVHYLRGVYLTSRDPEAARAEFKRELEITPGHIPARLQIGILDIKAGDTESAAGLAREVLKREPGNPLAHAILGRAHANRGEYAKAIPELETAIRLDAENAQLHFSLGQAYRHVGRDADARREEAEYQRLKASKRPDAG